MSGAAARCARHALRHQRLHARAALLGGARSTLALYARVLRAGRENGGGRSRRFRTSSSASARSIGSAMRASVRGGSPASSRPSLRNSSAARGEEFRRTTRATSSPRRLDAVRLCGPSSARPGGGSPNSSCTESTGCRVVGKAASGGARTRLPTLRLKLQGRGAQARAKRGSIAQRSARTRARQAPESCARFAGLALSPLLGPAGGGWPSLRVRPLRRLESAPSVSPTMAASDEDGEFEDALSEWAGEEDDAATTSGAAAAAPPPPAAPPLALCRRVSNAPRAWASSAAACASRAAAPLTPLAERHLVAAFPRLTPRLTQLQLAYGPSPTPVA